MLGEDKNDTITLNVNSNIDYVKDLTLSTIKGKRFGVLKELLQDTIYKQNVELLKNNGAIIVVFEPQKIQLEGFLTLLNIDMKYDLPKYLNQNADKNITVKKIEDIIEFNKQDTVLRAPYGQQLFEGIVKDSTTLAELNSIKNNLKKMGRQFFDEPMHAYNLDAILSINNYHAGFAAVAQYPCLTVPMGYHKSGEPIGLTFISKPFSEKKLLQFGYAFEQLSASRKLPKGY
jgi:amidase